MGHLQRVHGGLLEAKGHRSWGGAHRAGKKKKKILEDLDGELTGAKKYTRIIDNKFMVFTERWEREWTLSIYNVLIILLKES